jgi:hypothetical protein
MSDSYSEVSHRGLGDNLVESIKGVLVGIVLFIVSFPLLWWNEGRTDISTVAKKAAVVKADGSDKASGEGKLIAVTGDLKPEGTLGDPDFVKPGPYVSLSREAEMYAWVEKVTKKEEKKLGGGTKETKTYTYEKKWTSRPERSDDFRYPEGHENPAMSVRSDSWHAANATVGAYGFPPADITLPSAKPLSVPSENLLPGRHKKAGDYVFLGRGTLESPFLGDVRISWRAIESGRKVTAYGKGEGLKIVAYMHEGKDKLYRVVDGTHEEAIATLHGEHTTMTWILRLVGFLMMWFGLALVLGPINAVLDIIPFLGSTSRALTGIALFPIALILTGLTVVISIVAHNPILLVVVVVAFAGAAAFIIKSKAAKKKLAQKPA